MSYPLAKRLEEWRREDREMNDDPRPGEWQHCWHKSINEDGIFNDCGRRAAIMIHLEKRKPMNEEISFAVEEFEAACDLAIERIGGVNAYNILAQRRERADIISKLQPKEKYAQAHKPPVPAYSAGTDQEEEEHVEAIKALNKSLMG
jgi:hypothetical protein